MILRLLLAQMVSMSKRLLGAMVLDRVDIEADSVERPAASEADESEARNSCCHLLLGVRLCAAFACLFAVSGHQQDICKHREQLLSEQWVVVCPGIDHPLRAGAS